MFLRVLRCSCSYRLPELAPIVQGLCAEQGIPYKINKVQAAVTLQF